MVKTREELVQKIIQTDPGIKEAERQYQSLLKDKKFLRNYHLRQMLSDHTSEINHAREEGKVEGILEIARKMKKAGRPLSEITEFTGLPTETIVKL